MVPLAAISVLCVTEPTARQGLLLLLEEGRALFPTTQHLGAAPRAVLAL